MSQIQGNIIKIMRDVKAIKKDHRNVAQDYKFRGIDDIFNEVHPLFADHGVFITTKVLENVREDRQTKNGSNLIYSVLKIRFTFHAEDGSTVECETIGEGMDTGDKSANKAMSVALKYAIMQMLMIPTEDAKDPENGSPEPLPKGERPGHKTKIESKEVEVPKDWRQVPWHLPFGEHKATGYKYKGNTLGEILDKDSKGFSYWSKTYEPQAYKGEMNEADLRLRKALDMALEELGNAEEGNRERKAQDSQAEAPDKPNKSKEELLTALAGLCDTNSIKVSFVLSLLHKKGAVPVEVGSFDGVTTQVLGQIHDNFAWFVKQAEQNK